VGIIESLKNEINGFAERKNIVQLRITLKKHAFPLGGFPSLTIKKDHGCAIEMFDSHLHQ
jgi:hypothetical protein